MAKIDRDPPSGVPSTCCCTYPYNMKPLWQVTADQAQPRRSLSLRPTRVFSTPWLNRSKNISKSIGSAPSGNA